jgi:hypothetical protein
MLSMEQYSFLPPGKDILFSLENVPICPSKRSASVCQSQKSGEMVISIPKFFENPQTWITAGIGVGLGLVGFFLGRGTKR